MNKAVEVLLTVLALAGLYCAIPTTKTVVPGESVVRAQQEVVIADGSDPMPLCRARHCK
jgi:hypothetical protein